MFRMRMFDSSQLFFIHLQSLFSTYILVEQVLIDWVHKWVNEQVTNTRVYHRHVIRQILANEKKRRKNRSTFFIKAVAKRHISNEFARIMTRRFMSIDKYIDLSVSDVCHWSTMDMKWVIDSIVYKWFHWYATYFHDSFVSPTLFKPAKSSKNRRRDLTDEENDEIKEAFDLFDNDKDNELDYHEFKVSSIVATDKCHHVIITYN
jgi:hypothetical protein